MLCGHWWHTGGATPAGIDRNTTPPGPAMSPSLQRRLAFALFAALAMASAVGLTLLPAFDAVAPLRRMWGSAADALLLLAAGAGCLCMQRKLALAGVRAPALRAVLSAAWVLAAVWAAQSAGSSGPSDGRALLWLALTPAWLVVAGLWWRPARRSAVNPQVATADPVSSRPSARHSSFQTAGW